MFTTLWTFYLPYISLPVYRANNRFFYKHAALKSSVRDSKYDLNKINVQAPHLFSLASKQTETNNQNLHAPALQKGQANVTSNFGRCFLGVGLALDLRFPIMRQAYVYNLKYKIIVSIIRLPI